MTSLAITFISEANKISEQVTNACGSAIESCIENEIPIEAP